MCEETTDCHQRLNFHAYECSVTLRRIEDMLVEASKKSVVDGEGIGATEGDSDDVCVCLSVADHQRRR